MYNVSYLYRSTQTSGSPECSWMKFSIKCPRLEEHDEEVYEDLCYVTFSPRAFTEVRLKTVKLIYVMFDESVCFK